MIKHYSQVYMETTLRKIENYKRKTNTDQTNDSHTRQVVGYDIEFNVKNTIYLPLYGFLSGVIASTLGIGGGIGLYFLFHLFEISLIILFFSVIVPVMNAIGIDPVIAASTSSSMIFATSASSIVQFLIFGSLPWDYFFGLCIISGTGCLIGLPNNILIFFFFTHS